MSKAAVRDSALFIAGLGALAYAVWPPTLEVPYLTLAGSLLGAPALARAKP
jgi:hypothetical protein